MQTLGLGTPPRDDPFVGRGAELERLRSLAATDRPRVLFLHGVAGSGRSTLVHRFARGATGDGIRVVLLDCRGVEPTERGFLDALATGLDGEGRSAVDRALAERLAHLETHGRPLVIVLDHYEVLRLLDTWLRQQLVRRCPTGPGSCSRAARHRTRPGPACRRAPSTRSPWGRWTGARASTCCARSVSAR